MSRYVTFITRQALLYTEINKLFLESGLTDNEILEVLNEQVFMRTSYDMGVDRE